ncbi:MAG: AI-2E family transporter, partial [Patescibacteria group bacterium]
MKNQKTQSVLFLIILAVVLTLFLLLLKPYLGIIVASGALAVVFAPLYNKLVRLFKQKKTWAALASVLIVTLIVLAPLFLIGFQVYQEASGLYSNLSSGNLSQFNDLLNKAEKTIQKLSPGFSLNIKAQTILAPVANFTVQHLSGLFSGAAKLLLNLSLGLIALFYFFKEGQAIKKYLFNISPLADKNDNDIFTALKKTINASLKGGLLTAILQGLLIGLAFLIFGVPNAALWGAVGVIAALIPGIGLALIIIPAALYLVIIDKFFLALGFLVLTISLNAILDNFISPKLKKGAGLHPLII